MMLAITFQIALGFTLVFPVLPFVVEPLTGDESSVALWIGLLGSVYAACALFSAPIFGTLSDRVGRKPILVVSMIGTAVGWVVFGIGGSLWVLLLARIIDGVTAGEQSVAFAYMADITKPEDRAKRFGLLGAAAGVGLMVGPAVGGLLAGIDVRLPVFAAAAASAATALLIFVALPESLPPEKRTSGAVKVALNPFGTLTSAMRRPGLGARILVFGLLAFTLTVLSSNLPVLAFDVLDWGPTQIGLLLSAVGVIDVIVQGGLLGFLVKAAGERGVIIGGLLGLTVSFGMLVVLAAILPSPAVLVAATLLFATSEGATSATLQATLSESVAEDEQGGLAGGLSAVGSAAELVAPLLAGVLYSQVSAAAPYVLGSRGDRRCPVPHGPQDRRSCERTIERHHPLGRRSPGHPWDATRA